SSEGFIQPPFKIPLTENPTFMRFYESRQKGESFYAEEVGGAALEAHYQYMLSLPDFAPIAEKHVKAGFPLPSFQINHVANFAQGNLIFITNKPVPEAWEVFKRFAKVFEQTYTRFLDLQRAEAQAIEVVRAASLDRVRAEIASMRTADDLQRIIPLVWTELITLGVPFFRCGVFIVSEPEQLVHAYLSTPEGKSLAVLHLPFDSSETSRKTVENWHKQKVYTDHWNREQYQNWVQSMVDLGQIKTEDQYQGKAAPIDSLSLQFIPFSQGMLYVVSSESLTEPQINLVQSLADSFSVAYARYDDFRQLEDAKANIEGTLIELKATQSQLIQSEKMASLGEMTAGIAHEIQNPLNFVNNFSEVNTELIAEMQAKIQQGNLEEVQAIAADIAANEEKINHHGRRADAIVKSMLQHSRSSSNDKELTDINILADEYMRLCYHGLRAKDKLFNATIKTDFDTSIGKIKIIPQDIGRVVLNLVTNAFYAVNKRKQNGTEGYEPTVTLSTKKTGDLVEISVGDNGSGIPAKVLDKIFQPFFTTKPTGQGTGLGLSLSYDIIKTHGGEIKVDTKEGEGSEFIISLPRV
ncbi:MAG: ATP-binding protein, partial [Dyadobacter sp.]